MQRAKESIGAGLGIVFLTSCHLAGVPVAETKFGKSIPAPFGSWVSPLTAASIFESSDSISYLSASHGSLHFIESRAENNGRNMLVELDENQRAVPLTDPELSVRSRVHEYGGRPYLVVGEDIYYSGFEDQQIYKLSPGGEPLAITPEGLRYMECIVDERRQRVICIREDHRGAGEAVNTLVAISLEGRSATENEGVILFQGSDFVSSPALSPDGDSVAFITWSHPNMPWDDTELRVIRFDSSGAVSDLSEVGKTTGTAFGQPAFSKDGTLYFTAEWSNWQVLYRLGDNLKPELISDQQVEMNSFAFEGNSSVVVTYASNGLSHLARIDLASGRMEEIGPPFSTAGELAGTNGRLYFVASTPDTKRAIYELNGDNYDVIYQPNGPKIESDYLSLPQPVVYPTGEDEQAYGFFYAPRNADYHGPQGALPPLIVKVHGGPVGATSSTLDPGIQFWTSRGFAVFDINHRGSTGYGRSFRKKLYPNWGVVDIEDVANGAKWLADNDYVDGDKLAIRGGSAGGYTVLAALAFQQIFKAGTSYFGISDLEILAQDTHKFESRYPLQLIGAYPQDKEVYRARSPIYSVDDIDAPLLLLQGLDDEVVPPNQSQMIFEALKKNCIPTAYIPFDGEGHGFRQPANNVRALNSELDFYGQIFGFVPAGNIKRVELVRCKQEGGKVAGLSPG